MTERTMNFAMVGLLVAAVAVIVGRTIYLGRPAPQPAVFSAGLTLSEAKSRAATEDKPLFIVASARWCGPCQQYQRTTLADPALQEWVTRNAIPVHFDVDDDPHAAEALGVTSIPATIVLRRGVVLDRLSGARSADELIPWLTATLAAAPPATDEPPPEPQPAGDTTP